MKHLCCFLFLGLIFSSSHAQNEGQEITHYLFPEFKQGTILMKAGDSKETLLNYNSLTQEMIFENSGRKLALSPRDMVLIDTVFIKDRAFVPMEDHFIEAIYNSEWDLFIEHRCDVKEPGKQAGYGGTSKTTAVTSVSSVLSEGMMYELKLPDGYETRPYFYYWLKREGEITGLKSKKEVIERLNGEGEFYRFKSLRELKKLYKEKDDLYKAHLKENDVKFNNQESIIELIDYLESN